MKIPPNSPDVHRGGGGIEIARIKEVVEDVYSTKSNYGSGYI